LDGDQDGAKESNGSQGAENMDANSAKAMYLKDAARIAAAKAEKVK